MARACALLVEHLRRRPRRHERVEARDGAARDRDEDEREEGARHERPAAGRESADGRRLHLGADEEHRDDDEGDRSDLHVARQVVAGTEQHPHGQDRREEPVGRDRGRERRLREREEVRRARPRMARREESAEDDTRHEQRHADGRRLAHAARPDPVHVEAHQQRDGDRRGDRERPPGALGERLDDDEPEDRERDDDDEEDRDHRDDAAQRADLVARDLRERTAAAPEGSAEDDEVLHGTGEADAEHEPQEAGEPAELGREDRPDERPGARDRGEVMSPEDPAVRGMKILAVAARVRRRGAPVVQADHATREKSAVEAVEDRVDAERAEEQPERVDRHRRECNFGRRRPPPLLSTSCARACPRSRARSAAGRGRPCSP